MSTSANPHHRDATECDIELNLDTVVGIIEIWGFVHIATLDKSLLVQCREEAVFLKADSEAFRNTQFQ